MRTRPATAGLTTAAFALALAACSGGSGARESADDEVRPGYLAVADTSLSDTGALTIQLDYDSVEADGLDPQTATTARSWTLMSLVYDTLVTIGPEFEIEPELADFASPDPATYVFTLRDGVRFSNGRPVTPEDVVGSLERLLASQGAWAVQLSAVKSVEKTGAREVTVTLQKPQTAFLATLANTPAAILPMKEIEAGSVDITEQMLGTGPFVMESHRQDESWTFSKNERYRDADGVMVDALTIEIVGEESTRLAGIRDGSSDIAFFNNIDSIDLLGGTSDAHAVSQLNSDFYFLAINSQRDGSPLADKRVRFAINAALDRQEIGDLAFGGAVVPTGVSPAGLPDACDPSQLPSETTTTAEAEQLLEDAGASDLSLDLTIYSSEPATGQIAQMIEQQLERLGIEVEIDKVDDATFDQRVYVTQPGDFDLAISWFAGYGDAAMVSKWWNPQTVAAHAGFLANDPTLNELIEKAAAEPAGDQRADTITQLCERVDQNANMVPLVSRPAVIGYRTDAVSPTLYSHEGYGNILRNLADFRIVGSDEG